MADVTFGVVQGTARTTAGTKDFTLSGFGTPTAAWVITTNATALGTRTDDRWVCSSFCQGSHFNMATEQDEHGANRCDARRANSNTDVIYLVDNSGGSDGMAAGTDQAGSLTFITDGVRIDWTNGNASAYQVTVVLFGGADLSAKADSIQIPGSGSSSSYSSMGFEADVLLVHCADLSSIATTHGNDITNAFGIASNESGGVVQRSCNLNVDDGDNTSGLHSRLSNDRVIYSVNTTGSTHHTIDITAFDSTGFDYSYNSASVNHYLTFMGLKFGGANFKLVDWSSPSGTGNKSVTGVGFKPQFVLGTLTTHDSFNVTESDGTGCSRAWSIFTENEEASVCGTSEDASATMDTSVIVDNQAINFDDHDGTTEHAATFVSFDSGGWTLNYSTGDVANYNWFALAVEESAQNNFLYDRGIARNFARGIARGMH